MNDFITTYLEQRNLHFVVEDGVHLVPYGQPNLAPTFIVMIWTGALAAGGVMVELHHSPVGPQGDELTILQYCNDWNRVSRATKARFERDPDPRVVLDAWIPWTDGDPDDLLERFLDGAIADMLQSWPHQAGLAEAATSA